MHQSTNENFDASRRSFIKRAGAATILSGSIPNCFPLKPTNLPTNASGITERDDFKLYVKLLSEWCDALIRLQISDTSHKGLFGGILCPSCCRIHGRIGETAFPFMWMAQYTGNSKYRDAAVNVMTWAENNVSLPNGSWVNDVNVNLWNGITVFGSIALGETLKYHGHLLEQSVRDQWMQRLLRACDFLYDFMTIDTSNINYPLCSSYAFALGGNVLNNKKFIERGKYFASFAFDFFTKPNDLIYGECKPRTASPKGCLPIDLAYNVEETLPNLTNYALLMKDKKLLAFLVKSWKSHLELMLPDGTWDDSFGTRNHKWTMWGSRNSDGNQAGLTLLSSYSPIFAEAAYRNAQLLEKCTLNGILYGGPHYVSHGAKPCIHHTFSHAKSLADTLNHPDSFNGKFERVSLPREESNGIKKFAEADTWLVAEGPWRATITGNDCEYSESPHATGGSISLLYHQKLGLILTDSLGEWKMREAANMQMNTDPVFMTLVPRVEMIIDGVVYRSSRSLTANIFNKSAESGYSIGVKTNLLNFDLHEPASGEVICNIDYDFTQKDVTITAKMEVTAQHENLSFILPVISAQNEKLRQKSSNILEIDKPSGILTISSNTSLEIIGTGMKRIFSYSPGVEAIPISIKWNLRKYPKLIIRISC